MRAGAGTLTIWALPLGILALACLMVVTNPGGLATRVRGFEFDAYQRARPRLFEDTQARTGHAVRILDADAASIARFGHWPWSRGVLAKLVGELKEQGVAVVVVDLPLDEADPTVRLAQSLPN